MLKSSKDSNNIWKKVPIDYYQNGTKTNLLQRAWHSIKLKSAKKILKKHKFNTCLDIGCASGYMLSSLADSYPHASYFGVDVYKEAVDYARKTYPNIIFKVGYAERLPFEDESFDLISFYETIEHVDNPLMSLKEMRRVLKKGGLGIIAMDSGSLLFRIIWFIWENTTGKVWKGAHLHPFHFKQLEELIINSGFKIKKRFFTHMGMEVTFLVNK